MPARRPKKAASRRASAAARPGARRAAAKPAKRTAKRVTRKAAPKRTAKPARTVAKRTAKRVTRKAAPKRAAKPAAKRAKQAAKRGVRRAAPARAAARRATRAFAPAFAAQRAQAGARELLLFEIQRARVAVLSAIQGLTAGTAMRPLAPGKWSIHEIVLHLAVRDRVRLDEWASLLAGRRASWTDVHDPAALAAINEAHLAPLRARSWDEAVRLLSTTRDELMAALQAVPAEPADVWSPDHPFGAVLHALPPHDRKHAEQIKNARVAG